MKSYRFLFIFVFVLSLTTVGCDKLSFLEDYFPSLKKEGTKTTESAKVRAASNTKVEKPLAKDILVKTGSWTMTIQEFDEKLIALKEVLPDFDGKDIEGKKLVLEELIRQQLLVEAAEQKGIDKRKTFLNAIDEARKTFLVRELAVEIAESVKVTDEDAKIFYDENQQLFQEPTQWRIREIIVEDEQKAKDLNIAILQGADFAQVARDNSIVETSSDGGSTGFVAEFEDPKVQNAVFALEIGSISNVFKGDEGFYIIKLEEVKEGVLQKLEDVNEELKEGLMAMNQQQAIVDYVEDLRSKANIEINENLLK